MATATGTGGPDDDYVSGEEAEVDRFDKPVSTSTHEVQIGGDFNFGRDAYVDTGYEETHHEISTSYEPPAEEEEEEMMPSQETFAAPLDSFPESGNPDILRIMEQELMKGFGGGMPAFMNSMKPEKKPAKK